MGRAGIPILCYNFMAGTDWVRTCLHAPQRGGALVTAFDLDDAERSVSLNHREPHKETQLDADSLWRNLERLSVGRSGIVAPSVPIMCRS
jgi:mannonate dehydratase